jgi:hypothetical protein
MGIGINHAAAQPIKEVDTDIDSNSTFKTVHSTILTSIVTSVWLHTKNLQ